MSRKLISDYASENERLVAENVQLRGELANYRYAKTRWKFVAASLASTPARHTAIVITHPQIWSADFGCFTPRC
jgi:hypothetical protein